MVPDADGAVDRLFDLAVVLGDLMNRTLAVHGLTAARAEVIWVLHHSGRLTQRELSEVLKCTPRNVTGLVDALQVAGLVVRTPHPTDRRAVLVSLTERGAALVSQWSAERADSTARLFGDTSDSELVAFVTVLDRVLVALRQGDAAPRDR